MIAGLLLAAGRGSRFGGDKLMAPLAGRPVIHWSADALAPLDARWAVVPPDAPVSRALAAMGVRIIAHAGHADGMGSSLAAGVAALPADVDAVVVALGDQPLVSPEVVTRLVERWRATGSRAVAPRYHDGRGHPVLFDRACFPALLALRGDTGARRVLDSLGDGLSLMDVDAMTPLDVDTREALARVEEEVKRVAGDG